MLSPRQTYSSKFETQTPNSTGSLKRKSFSNLLWKNRGDARDDHSDNSRHSSPNHRHSNHLSTFERKAYNPRKASVASHATSSASSDPSSAAGSAFAQPSAFSGSFVKNLPGGSTMSQYPPLRKQDSMDSLYSNDESRSFNSEGLRRRIMARRTSRKNRERAARTQSPSSDGGDSYTAPIRRNRSSANVAERRSRTKLSEDEGYSGRRSRSMYKSTAYQSKSATNLLDKKRSLLQSPRKSAPSSRLPFTGEDARSPAQSPRYRQRRKSRDEDEDNTDRDRSYTPVQRSRHSQQSHVQRRGRKMRDASSDYHNMTDRSVSSNAGYRNTRKTSPTPSPAPRRKSGERRHSGGSDRRRQASPRPELSKVQSDNVAASRRTRSPYTSSRKRRADTYPSPSHDHSASPRRQRRTVSPAPKPQRQRSLTPPGRRTPYTSQRSPRAPKSRARSPSAPELKTYRLSELIPECRLYHIEARGGRRDFRKWFSTLPPNIKVDKDMKTDRGVFKKDNFATSAKLDEYLGINRSHSPPDSRSRRQRR